MQAPHIKIRLQAAKIKNHGIRIVHLPVSHPSGPRRDAVARCPIKVHFRELHIRRIFHHFIG